MHKRNPVVRPKKRKPVAVLKRQRNANRPRQNAVPLALPQKNANAGLQRKRKSSDAVQQRKSAARQ